MIFSCIQELTTAIGDDYINPKDKHISVEDTIMGNKFKNNKNEDKKTR